MTDARRPRRGDGVLTLNGRLVGAAILLLVTTAAVRADRVYYVDLTVAGGAHDGSTWANAFDNLQDALLDAATNGPQTEIWVAAGVYTPDQGVDQTPGDRNATFQLHSDVGVFGGFAGWETQRAQRDPEANLTILSGDLSGNDGPNFTNYGDNSYHVITGSETDTTALLDGFDVEGGNTDTTAPTLKLGGALYAEYGNFTVSNCHFIGNYAWGGGGAIFAQFAGPTFINCRFTANANEPGIGSGGGAVISHIASNTLFINCAFVGNQSDFGGAFETWHGSATLINCSFANNHAFVSGGAVECSYDPSYFPFSSDTTLANCILWDNSAEMTGDQLATTWGTNAYVSVTHSDVAGGLAAIDDSGGGTIDWHVSTNLDINPLFLDADGADNTPGTEDDDLSLTVTSPVIDEGTNGVVSTDVDLAGNLRVRDGGAGTPIVDLGAYEYTEFCVVEETPDGVMDRDTDGDVDLNDYAAFFGCLSGPSGGIGPNCGVFNTDADDDIDLIDYQAFQLAFGGAGWEPTQITVSPNVLDFGLAATLLNLNIASICGDAQFTVDENASWLTVTPSIGQVAGGQQTISVIVDRTGLPADVYQAQIAITPNVGDTEFITVSMRTQDVPPPEGLVPIARWDVVPHQRIGPGETFNAGVVAFSKNGISKVSFSVNGGAETDVAAMTYNDRTNVYEYWIPIAAADFATAGEISVDATVHDAGGGTRILETLRMVVDPGGTLPQPQAWVSTSGNDSTGQVNNNGKPYRSIGKAIDGIRAWMQSNGQGNRADGGIVRLQPGTHTLSNGGVFAEIPTTREWVTITTASGGTRANTKILDRETTQPRVPLLKCSGITVQSGGKWRYVFVAPSGFTYGRVWLHDCDIIGGGRHQAGSHPVQNTTVGSEYYTESYVYDTDFAVGGGSLARNLTIEHIGNDAFQHCPMVVNCTADDVDPGDTGWHSDGWQWFATGGPDNTIVYNFRFSDAHYQSIMCRTGVRSAPAAKNVAFVNVYSEMRPPYRKPNGPVSLWMRSVDHFLLWNCTFIDHPFNIYNDKSGDTIPTYIANFDVRGVRFNTLKHSTPGGNVDFNSFQSNHFVVSSGAQVITPGADVTTGSAQLDTYGRPLATSPLRDRVSAPPVPTDADGVTRTAPADVGAYEYQP